MNDYRPTLPTIETNEDEEEIVTNSTDRGADNSLSNGVGVPWTGVGVEEPPPGALVRTRSLTLTLNDDAPAKKRHGPSKEDYSSLLSTLYAIILVLLGLLFPLTEALKNRWLDTAHVAAFLVYIYVVASAFLLYFQLYLLPNHPDKKHNEHGSKRHVYEASKIRKSASGIHITDADVLPKSPPPPSATQSTTNGTKRLKYRKAKVTRRHSEEPYEVRNGGGGGGGRMQVNRTGLSTMIRFNSSSSVNHVMGGEERDSYEQRAGDEWVNSDETRVPGVVGGGVTRQMSRMLNDSHVSAQLGEFVEEELDVYIDVSLLGNLFSHEGSSFYLRMGTLMFGIGHIVYIVLEIENHSHAKGPPCPSIQFWWIYYIRLVFIILQTFFIFKNPTVSIYKQEPLARLGFMHLIATNMCVWMGTLINEIMEESNHILTSNNDSATVHVVSSSLGVAQPFLLQNNTTQSSLTSTSQYFDDHNDNCRGIVKYAAPYLFPFILEFSLVAMGAISIMYFSIEDKTSNSVVQGLSNLIRVHTMENEAGSENQEGEQPGDTSGTAGHHEENLLAKSHRGMFLGILLLAGSIISVVLFLFEVGQDADRAEYIYLISDMTIHAQLLIATIVAIIRLHKLNFVAKPASIDDILLLIAMSGSVLFETSMIAAAGVDLSNENTQKFIPAILGVFTGLVAAIQTIAQVIVIASGMRRYPSKREHIRNMPGRGSITFLVVANVSVWIFRTLQAKNLTLHTLQLTYYGDLAWLLLVNISLPLLLFYRFHSSICLADVWHSAYTPLHEKINKDGTSPPAGFQPLDQNQTNYGGGHGGRQRMMGSGGMFGSQLIQAVSYSNISPIQSRMDLYRGSGVIGFRGSAGGSLRSLRPVSEQLNDVVVENGFGAHHL